MYEYEKCVCVFFVCLFFVPPAAAEESRGIRRLRQPPQPGLQEVCETGLRVHANGRG